MWFFCSLCSPKNLCVLSFERTNVNWPLTIHALHSYSLCVMKIFFRLFVLVLTVCCDNEIVTQNREKRMWNDQTVTLYHQPTIKYWTKTTTTTTSTNNWARGARISEMCEIENVCAEVLILQVNTYVWWMDVVLVVSSRLLKLTENNTISTIWCKPNLL